MDSYTVTVQPSGYVFVSKDVEFPDVSERGTRLWNGEAASIDNAFEMAMKVEPKLNARTWRVDGVKPVKIEPPPSKTVGEYLMVIVKQPAKPKI